MAMLNRSIALGMVSDVYRISWPTFHPVATPDHDGEANELDDRSES